MGSWIVKVIKFILISITFKSKPLFFQLDIVVSFSLSQRDDSNWLSLYMYKNKKIRHN
jgi:hypothetical protein